MTVECLVCNKTFDVCQIDGGIIAVKPNDPNSHECLFCGSFVMGAVAELLNLDDEEDTRWLIEN